MRYWFGLVITIAFAVHPDAKKVVKAFMVQSHYTLKRFNGGNFGVSKPVVKLNAYVTTRQGLLSPQNTFSCGLASN